MSEDQKENSKELKPVNPLVLDPEFEGIDLTVQDLIAFYLNTNNSDGLRLKALKLALSMDPSQADKLGGNIVDQVERQILSLMSGNNQYLTEIGRAKMKHEKKKLIGSVKDPVVSMLADRVALTWIRLQDAEIQLSAEGQRRSLRQHASLQNTVTRCQSNYLAALAAFENFKRSKERLEEMKANAKKEEERRELYRKQFKKNRKRDRSEKKDSPSHEPILEIPDRKLGQQAELE